MAEENSQGKRNTNSEDISNNFTQKEKAEPNLSSDVTKELKQDSLTPPSPDMVPIDLPAPAQATSSEGNSSSDKEIPDPPQTAPSEPQSVRPGTLNQPQKPTPEPNGFNPPTSQPVIPQPTMPQVDMSQNPVGNGAQTDKKVKRSFDFRKSVDAIKALPTKVKALVGGGILLIIILIIVGLFATHIICFHDWEDATCTAPKTCAICGATEGSALGHTVTEWEMDAEPTCSKEGQEHGTCTRCGQLIIESIPMVDHTPGEWEVTKEYSISSSGTVIPGTQTQYCSVCGAQLDTKEYTIELTIGQTNALRKAASYLDYMAFSYSGLVDQLEYEGYSTDDATFAVDHCGADWNEQAAKKAQSYLDFMSFSRSGLIDQLLYEGFTQEQAEYGVSAVGY